MPERLARRVALIGWDAADWKIIHPLLDAGLMPNLRKMVEHGAMGNIATLDPPMSPLLWTSIATGKTADLHGIHGFAEADPVTGGVRPVTSTSRKGKALWNILSQSGLRSLVVNWFASHPAEPINGVIVSNAFSVSAGSSLPAGTIHPPSLSAELAELRVVAADLTGDDLLPFIPALGMINQKTDHRPEVLAKVLAENISAQAAATWLMEKEPWDFLAVYFDLLDHAGHAFMRYRAPRMENVSEKDFEIYQHVVDGAYCFQDAMLGRMAALAGPETVFIVVSDHGFHSDHRRGLGATTVAHEAPMQWHRSHGIVCVAGPGIPADELFYGATLLDVTPTVLTLFGLPAASDMRGRVLAEALDKDKAAVLERIPSWEDVPGESGMHLTEASANVWDSAAVMEQMVALGYLEPLAPDAENQLRQVRVHQAFGLARVYLGLGNPGAAVAPMEEAVRECPEEITYQIYLAQCYYETGRIDDCRRVVRGVLDRGGDRPAARALEANLFLAEGRIEEGLAGLLAAEQSEKPAPNVRYAIAHVYLSQKRWADAERAFRSMLTWDEDFAPARQGLAKALLEQRRFEEAAEAAADALALRFDLPEAHLTLGLALGKLGQNKRARQAFETCLALRPDSAVARQSLARLRKRPEHALASR